jgi:hypothetical protein
LDLFEARKAAQLSLIVEIPPGLPVVLTLG